MTTLEKRRLRGDMIETFKIIKGLESIPPSKLFDSSPNVHNTRGHSLKLNKTRSNLEIRRNFFSQRVVNEWNSLPACAISSSTVIEFKTQIDKGSVADGQAPMGYSTY